MTMGRWASVSAVNPAMSANRNVAVIASGSPVGWYGGWFVTGQGRRERLVQLRPRQFPGRRPSWEHLRLAGLKLMAAAPSTVASSR